MVPAPSTEVTVGPRSTSVMDCKMSHGLISWTRRVLEGNSGFLHLLGKFLCQGPSKQPPHDVLHNTSSRMMYFSAVSTLARSSSINFLTFEFLFFLTVFSVSSNVYLLLL